MMYGLGATQLTYPLDSYASGAGWIVIDKNACPAPKPYAGEACPSGFSPKLTQLHQIGIDPQNNVTYACPQYTCQSDAGLSPYDATAAGCPKFTPTQEFIGAATIAAFALLGNYRWWALLGIPAFIMSAIGESMRPAYDASGKLIPGKCEAQSISW